MPWGLAATSARLAAALNLLVKNFRKYYYRLIFTTGPKPIFTTGSGASGEISAVKMGIPDMHVNYIHDFLADRMHVDA